MMVSLGLRFSLNSELVRLNLLICLSRCAFLIFQLLHEVPFVALAYISDHCNEIFKGSRKGYFMPLTLEEQTFEFCEFSWGARNSE